MTHAERIVRILLEDGPDIRGEYWIIDGDVAFADGDVGDVNHEAYATDHARRTILDHFGGDSDGEVITDEELDQAAAEALAEVGIPFNPDDWYPAAKRLLSEQPNSEAMIATLQCALGMGDAREIAMKYWGWKWCRRSNIATWTFTATDRQQIVRGLNEIVSQEMHDDGEDWDNLEITIGVGATGKRYSMTIAELESGRVVSQDPTWGLRENDDAMMRHMMPEIDRLTSYRKFHPDEELSNATFNTAHLCRRALDKFKEIHYDGYKNFVLKYQSYIDALKLIEEPGADQGDDFVSAHEAVDQLWELLQDALHKYCPVGYYLGSHPGSGSLIGCWREEE